MMLNLCRASNCTRVLPIEPVLFLYMLAIFAQYSVFQELVYSRVCLEKYDPVVCADLEPSRNPDSSQGVVDYVQATASTWILLATISTIVPSIFVAVYLGSWSDRFGRKWPVAIPPLGGAAGSLAYIIIASHPNVPVGWICLASVFPGLSGGFTSCMMSSASYISSTTTEGQRTVRLSRLEAMTFLGGTLGPFISALLLSLASLPYAFLFMLACYLTAFLYVAVFITDVPSAGYEHDGFHQSRTVLAAQEDANCDRNATFSGGERKAELKQNAPLLQSNGNSFQNPISGDNGAISRRLSGGGSLNPPESCCQRYFGAKHFFQCLTTCCRSRPNGRRRQILVILGAAFVLMTVTAGEPDVGFLFARDVPLGWSPAFYSYFIGLRYGIGSIVLLLGMPIFRRLKVTDVSVCVIGIISRMASLVSFGLSTSTQIALLAPLLGLLSFTSIPTIRAMLSKLVEPGEQGKMFAFVAIMEDVCTLSASALFNGLYPLLRPIFHGFIFQVAAISLLLPLALIWSLGSNP